MGRISSYAADTSPTDNDLVITVDVETGNNRKVTLSVLKTYIANALALVSPTVSSPPSNIARLTGEIIPYGGRTSPNSSWLLCDGSAVSRTTYSDLFGVIVPTVGTFTVTIASPAVVTLNSHGLNTGSQVYLTTTGALPTGLSANTLYYVIKIDSNTFNLATSRANAYAGTKITTTGSQSGTHTLLACPWGLGNGSTTFNIPDLRGRTLAGDDYMGGTAASRLNLAQSQGVYGNLGASGGEQGHQLTQSELAAHSHQVGTSLSGANGAFGNLVVDIGGSSKNTSNTGGDASHNNVQPTAIANFLIKT